MSKTAGAGTPAAEGEAAARADNLETLGRRAAFEAARLDRFYVVIAPGPESTLADIVYGLDRGGVTAVEFARCVLGGLKPEEIRGTFTDRAAAVAFAAEEFTIAGEHLMDEARATVTRAQAMFHRAGGVGAVPDPRD